MLLKQGVALQGADLGSWDWNIQTGQVSFNARWAEMLGYRLDEIEPDVRSWEVLVHPDDMPRAREVLTAHLEGGAPFYEAEHRMRHKSGAWLWVLDRGKVIERNATGEPMRAAGTHLDISERKAAEEALRASEARLRAVIDGAPFGAHSYELQPDGRLVFSGANRSAGRILAIEHSSLIGKSIEEAFPGLVNTPIPDAYRRVATTGDSWNTDQVDYEKGQIRGAFEIHAFQTGADRMTVFFRDITERKRAEEALRKYERIASTSQDLMALTNRDYVYEAANESVLIAHERPRDEVVGHKPSEVMGANFFEEKPRRRLDQALSGQMVRFQETFNFARLGRRIMDVNYFPLLDEKGMVEGVVLNARDITETRKLEEQLMHSQKIESIGTLAGGVAHEINNPINGIMNYAQMISDRLEMESPARDFAEEILKETQGIAKIVRNLLTFARNEKQSHSPALLSDIISSVLSLIQTVMRRDQLICTSRFPMICPRSSAAASRSSRC